jgi:hypothetical protein
LVVVFLGDSVDGFHHGSLQESIFKEQDQCAAHVELMQKFLKTAGFGRGDELHYVKGTETHVKDTEQEIAKELRAKPNEEGEYISDALMLNINGTWHGFVHHGKQRGSGQNEGNSLRNFLRDVRSDREKDGLQRLDVLWSGHTHGHSWNTHIARRGGNFHEFHGIICPSFQAKTRYAYKVVPMAVNSVGGTYMRITADGQIGRPTFEVESTE